MLFDVCRIPLGILLYISSILEIYFFVANQGRNVATPDLKSLWTWKLHFFGPDLTDKGDAIQLLG
jgi:hypothetical protein